MAYKRRVPKPPAAPHDGADSLSQDKAAKSAAPPPRPAEVKKSAIATALEKAEQALAQTQRRQPPLWANLPAHLTARAIEPSIEEGRKARLRAKFAALGFELYKPTGGEDPIHSPPIPGAEIWVGPAALEHVFKISQADRRIKFLRSLPGSDSIPAHKEQIAALEAHKARLRDLIADAKGA